LHKALIVIILVFFSGCSPARFNKGSNPVLTSEGAGEMIEKIIGNNLSEENFFIEKGSVSLNIEEKTSRYYFTLKYRKPDIYLISVRNAAGLEGARIFFSGDTIMINERMGKRVIFGKIEDVERRLGFPFFTLKLAFGDLYIDNKIRINETERFSNKITVNQNYQNKDLTYFLDLKVQKAEKVSYYDLEKNERIEIIYSKFDKKEYHFPHLVEIKDEKRKISAKLRIDRVVIPWNGIIEFIPGAGYTREEIR
jgi:hypothetical protein